MGSRERRNARGVGKHIGRASAAGEILVRWEMRRAGPGGRADRPIVGPLVELRRAAWIPIERNGQLKGVILAGSRGKQAFGSLDWMQSVAAELALAIGLEEEQGIARIRNADLRAARNILEARRGRNPAGMMLAKLADSCTEKGSGEQGPGAAFAVIGALVEHEEQSSKKRGDRISLEERRRGV